MTVVNMDNYRPHESAYVACMECGQDWVAVFPRGAEPLECPQCGQTAGETVKPRDEKFFKRFMRPGLSRSQQTRRTMVLLNAAQAWKD